MYLFAKYSVCFVYWLATNCFAGGGVHTSLRSTRLNLSHVTTTPPLHTPPLYTSSFFSQRSERVLLALLLPRPHLAALPVQSVQRHRAQLLLPPPHQALHPEPYCHQADAVQQGPQAEPGRAGLWRRVQQGTQLSCVLLCILCCVLWNSNILLCMFLLT